MPYKRKRTNNTSKYIFFQPVRAGLIHVHLVKTQLSGFPDNTQEIEWGQIHWPPTDSYSAHSEGEIGVLRQNNSLFLNVSYEISVD